MNNFSKASTAISDMQKGQAVAFFVLAEEYSGQRIDNFLFRELKRIPKSHIYKMLRKGEIRINRKRIKPEYKINGGDVIRIPPLWQINCNDKNNRNRPNDNDDSCYDHEGNNGHVGKRNIVAPTAKITHLLLQSIIYEDDALIVINKPAGMAAHGGSGINFGVIETMRRTRPDLRYLELVHRLDRGTSGCMLLAKKRSMLRVLHQLLREGKIDKTYVLLVKGKWLWQEEKRIDVALLKNQLSSGERLVKVSAVGKMALTTLRPRQIFESSNSNCSAPCSASLLEAQIHTGKTHQIRVHAAHLGFPLAGDDKYGDKEFNQLMQKKLGLRRLFLHAAAIKFCLPRTEQEPELTNVLSKIHQDKVLQATRRTQFHVVAPLASELSAVLQRLGDL